jgi:hypothetical protein
MRDGDQIAYAAQGGEVLHGTRGRVLRCTASYAHVQWAEGVKAGQVDLVPTEDLDRLSTSSNAVTASLDDSLEVGSLISVASAQEAYEETGGGGLISHLASGGYLASYSSVAEEALQLLTARLQQDAVLRQLTSSMDPEEADEVYRLAARTLLTDSGDF